MQRTTASLLKAAGKFLSELGIFCVGIFRYKREEEQRTRLDAAEKKAFEWELKYHASESEKETLRRKVHLLAAMVLCLMIFPHERVLFFIAIFAVGVAYSNEMLSVPDSFARYANQIRQATGRVARATARTIREWKSVPVSPSFKTTK